MFVVQVQNCSADKTDMDVSGSSWKRQDSLSPISVDYLR